MLELSSGRVDRLDDLTRPDELDAFDDHLLAGLEPRFEDAQALVVVDRLDADDLHLVLRVDDKDARALPDLRGPLVPERPRRRHTRR